MTAQPGPRAPLPWLDLDESVKRCRRSAAPPAQRGPSACPRGGEGGRVQIALIAWMWAVWSRGVFRNDPAPPLAGRWTVPHPARTCAPLDRPGRRRACASATPPPLPVVALHADAHGRHGGCWPLRGSPRARLRPCPSHHASGRPSTTPRPACFALALAAVGRVSGGGNAKGAAFGPLCPHSKTRSYLFARVGVFFNAIR